MAEITIEDARRAVTDHLTGHCQPGRYPQSNCCEPVIDAYAVAVLEEAETCYARNYAGANEGDDVATSFLRVRARIAALGGKDGR